MLTAFVVLMAAAGHGGGNESHGRHGGSSGGGQRRSSHQNRARNKMSARPRPTHFLSVRIDDPVIWEKFLAIMDHVTVSATDRVQVFRLLAERGIKMASVQHDIVEEHTHLENAVIPVQDAHLTLFVATLREEDGTLERAKKTLEGCRDILHKHGLAVMESRANESEKAQAPQSNRESGNYEAVAAGLDAASDKSGDAMVSKTSDYDEITPRIPHERTVSGDNVGQVENVANTEVEPLTLEFNGLGNFGNKVLFARLAEDGQAARFRRLAASLHARFLEAQLLEETAPKASANNNTNSDDDNENVESHEAHNSDSKKDGDFRFKPHLTVMKTSKLKNRKTTIPPSAYAGRMDCYFGSHAPAAVELSSMQEKEETIGTPAGWDSKLYYKCEHRIALPSTR